MQSLRRFRKIIVLAALVWLPMSVFAQICATHALVAHIGGPQDRALVVPQEMSSDAATESAIATVDAATFWQSVDDFDTGCDSNAKSACALATMTALIASTRALTFANEMAIQQMLISAFSTRELCPDTPPPRL